MNRFLAWFTHMTGLIIYIANVHGSSERPLLAAIFFLLCALFWQQEGNRTHE